MGDSRKNVLTVLTGIIRSSDFLVLMLIALFANKKGEKINVYKYKNCDKIDFHKTLQVHHNGTEVEMKSFIHTFDSPKTLVSKTSTLVRLRQELDLFYDN